MRRRTVLAASFVATFAAGAIGCNSEKPPTTRQVVGNPPFVPTASAPETPTAATVPTAPSASAPAPADSTAPSVSGRRGPRLNPPPPAF